MNSTLNTYLHTHQIPYKIYEHPAVFTVEHSKKLKINVPGVPTKNLFLKATPTRFYLVCLPADKRLNIKALEQHLKVKKLKFGSPQELKLELHLTPGSVSLFGMIYATYTHLLIDTALWSAQAVGFHPNANTATLVLSHNALATFLDSLSAPWEVLDCA